MKKIVLITLALSTFLFQACEKDPEVVKTTINPVPAQPGKWRQMLDTSNIEIIQNASFSIGDKGFTINPQTNEVYEYDATKNKITKKSDFPGPRRQTGPVAFAMGNKGYYGFGQGQRELKEGSQTQWTYTYRVDFWEYNPGDDSWTRKADCPIPPNPNQFEPKRASFYGGYGMGLNNKGYVGSGRDINESIRSYLYEYDPRLDRWDSAASASMGNYPPGFSNIEIAFSIGNKGYIGKSDTLWEFDPAATIKWKLMRTVPESAKHPVLSLGTATKGYLYGSINSLNRLKPELTNEVYEFTPGPSGGTWKKVDDFAGPSRANCLGFSLNNRIYIGFGSNMAAAVLTDMWEYMPGP